MNHKKLHYILLFAFVAAVFTSCTKDTQVASRAAITCDCTPMYANEKKMKTITVTDNGSVKNTYQFKYKNGLVDSIYITDVNSKTIMAYNVSYPSNSCQPSGYSVALGSSNGGYNEGRSLGTFLIDGKYITEKQVGPDYNSEIQAPPAGDTYGYIYRTNSSGLITSWSYSEPGFRNDGAGQNIFYKGKNVDSAQSYEDYIENIKVRYNTKLNPFYNQDKLLFYLTINPYNLFKGDTFQHYGFNLLLNILLSPNTPVTIKFDNFNETDYFDFTYVYNAQSYPTKITMKQTQYDTHDFAGTEVLDITYY